MKKNVIILGNDHTNTLGLTQVLGREGYYVIDVVWGLKRGYVKSSRYCCEFYSAHTPLDCIDILLSLKHKEIIPIIASCDDAACALESNRDKLCEKYIFEYTNKKHTIIDLMDKPLQVKYACAAGMNVPTTWQIEDENLFQYPIIIKPEESRLGAKADLRICSTPEEFKREIVSLKHTKKAIVQQYIDRDYEISILGCALSNGDVYIPCVENKLTLYPPLVGLECLANLQLLNDIKLKTSITKMVNLMGYVGLFSVEMMHNKFDNRFYFTEINLRNDGANSFVYKTGFNLPLLHICDLMGSQLPEFALTAPGYYIWEMHHFMSLRTKSISFKQWYKELRMARDFLTYFREDKKPFFKQFLYLITRHFQYKKNQNY